MDLDDKMSAGQRAYEAKRAAKKGQSLGKHLAEKAKTAAPLAPKPVKKPGLFARLLDRAHQPLKPQAPKKK